MKEKDSNLENRQLEIKKDNIFVVPEIPDEIAALPEIKLPMTPSSLVTAKHIPI